MPDDRLFHARAGHSQKVSSLSDLEFRIWWTYQIAADDYGVMRRSPVALQNANKALEQRPARQVAKSLEAVIATGLMVTFDHQGERFVCQLDWQDWQKVRHPRATVLPVPPTEILQRCSGSTRELFLSRSGNVSEMFPPLAGAGGRETANGYRQEANGSRLPARPRTFGRIDLHRWQLDALLGMLGPLGAEFGLDEWVHGLSKLADERKLVLDKRTLWPWVQAELRAECERRGLTVAGEHMATEADREAKLRAAIAEMDAAAGGRR